MSEGARSPSVLLVNAFHRETTGADRYCRDLAALLVSHGHRVAPFAARHEANDDAGPWERFFPEGADSAPNARPGPLRRFRDGLHFLYSMEAREGARRMAEAFRPDLVHAHNLYHHLSPSVLSSLRRPGLPIVMTLHDYKLICPNYSLYTQGTPCTACRGGRFWNAVRYRCVRDSRLYSGVCGLENTLHWVLDLYGRGVDLWIAPSRFLLERFVEFGYPERKIRMIPHFVRARPTSREDDEDFVLFAGRLVEVKGVEILLRAWRKTRARRSLRLLIAGEGPLRSRLERGVADDSLSGVEFLGLVDRRRLEGLFERALAVVVPSVWYEVFGLVAAEAFAFGRPVVASDIGGLGELVQHGVTGLLVPPGDVEALARAIDDLADSAETRRSLGAGGKAYALRELSPERHYERLRDVYRDAARCAS